MLKKIALVMLLALPMGVFAQHLKFGHINACLLYTSHIRCGEAHAEVNEIRSVQDESLLKRSTIYVSLEPCSHYGKTPPCADLIIEKQIPRIVIGCQGKV